MCLGKFVSSVSWLISIRKAAHRGHSTENYHHYLETKVAIWYIVSLSPRQRKKWTEKGIILLILCSHASLRNTTQPFQLQKPRSPQALQSRLALLLSEKRTWLSPGSLLSVGQINLNLFISPFSSPQHSCNYNLLERSTEFTARYILEETSALPGAIKWYLNHSINLYAMSGSSHTNSFQDKMANLWWLCSSQRRAFGKSVQREEPFVHYPTVNPC